MKRTKWFLISCLLLSVTLNCFLLVDRWDKDSKSIQYEELYKQAGENLRTSLYWFKEETKQDGQEQVYALYRSYQYMNEAAAKMEKCLRELNRQGLDTESLESSLAFIQHSMLDGLLNLALGKEAELVLARDHLIYWTDYLPKEFPAGNKQAKKAEELKKIMDTYKQNYLNPNGTIKLES